MSHAGMIAKLHPWEAAKRFDGGVGLLRANSETGCLEPVWHVRVDILRDLGLTDEAYDHLKSGGAVELVLTEVIRVKGDENDGSEDDVAM